MIRFLTLIAILMTAAAPSAAIARPGNDEGGAPPPKPALLAAVVTLGGGPDRFSGKVFREALSAGADEEKVLRATMGSSVSRFDEAFTFVVKDALTILKRTGKVLPPASPDPKDPKAVAAAVYQVGLHDGAFDIERLFDALFTPSVHAHAMTAVAQRYGAAGETAFHQVLARLITDLGAK